MIVRVRMVDEQVRKQYDAVRKRVGLIDLSRRGKIEVTGPDRVTFLHNMITNDVTGLEEGAGRYGAFLTARGKMVADFFYYRLPGRVLLDLPGPATGKTRQELGRYIIMDEVELEDRSAQLGHLSLQGPAAAELVSALTGGESPRGRYRAQSSEWSGRELLVICRDQLGFGGFELVFDRDRTSELETEMTRRGAVRIGPEAFEILRLEAGLPLWGRDFDEKRYPMEARLQEALSFDKGCYIGQEVVAKATHIGGVANLLMRLKLEGDLVPRPGDPVSDAEGGALGRVTSAVYSPRLAGPIAFAYLKRARAQTGARVWVGAGAGRTPARVVEEFL